MFQNSSHGVVFWFSTSSNKPSAHDTFLLLNGCHFYLSMGRRFPASRNGTLRSVVMLDKECDLPMFPRNPSLALCKPRLQQLLPLQPLRGLPARYPRCTRPATARLGPSPPSPAAPQRPRSRGAAHLPAGDLLGAHGGGATGWSRTEISEPPAPWPSPAPPRPARVAASLLRAPPLLVRYF